MSVFRCTFYHLLQFICGTVKRWPNPTAALSFFHRFIYFRSWCRRQKKKASLYAKLLMQFFFLCRPRRCFAAFTISANTHSHVHQHRQYSPTQLFSRFLHFCTRCKFILAPSSTLFDSLMVKWLYGLVWSVVCYFNFLCLFLG